MKIFCQSCCQASENTPENGFCERLSGKKQRLIQRQIKIRKKKTCQVWIFCLNRPLTQRAKPGRCAEVAQLVEQGTENPRVGSSILSLGTTNLSEKDPKRPVSLGFSDTGLFCSSGIQQQTPSTSGCLVGISVGRSGRSTLFRGHVFKIYRQDTYRHHETH